MGVKPMSPSANFTTHRRPAAAPGSTGNNNNNNKSSEDSEAFASDESSCSSNGHGHPRHTRSGSSGGGLFRFLLCSSRPCVMEEEELANRRRRAIAAAAAAADLDEFDPSSNNTSSGDLNHNAQLRTELQAVMRHLEVRWQLFDEALSRFGDVEAMLAICTEKVRWRQENASGVMEVRIAEELRSLIARKLSMEVSIHRIVQLSSVGKLGSSLDQRGRLGHETGGLQGAMEFFYENEDDEEEIGSARPCVIEEDTYVLCNNRGEVVEEGKQVVLWEQYNATWYIRGCVSYPATSKLHT